MTTPVIMYAFWGRRGNVELQLPLIDRVLAENPHVEFQGWNLANDPADRLWLRSLPTRERFTIRHDFAGPRGQWRMNRVWLHYTAPTYASRVFVKIDDDVLFWQTDRFADFVAAIQAHPDAVISALTINNGASTPLIPGLWDRFTALDIPLLDVHLSNEFAEVAHQFFFEHWRDLVDQPVELVPTEDWCSINMVGFTGPVLKRITGRLNRPSPRWIAGREWPPRQRIGDEGSANLLPRFVLKGFTAAHATFGPQYCTPEQLAPWRARYAAIGQEYLAANRAVAR